VPDKYLPPWVFVLFLLGALFLMFVVVGCAAPFTPEAVHPSRARILELAATPDQIIPPLTEIAIRVYPATVLAGGAVRVTCLVPHHDDYRTVGYGIAGIQTSARQVAEVSYERVIEFIPCGEWTAFCTVTGKGRVLARREQTLTARGSCNDGDR
jgi:hypothetical protein